MTPKKGSSTQGAVKRDPCRTPYDDNPVVCTNSNDP
uniref:Uncharacterized protein n=1 Tax=Lepeophtheirus salmonis TaxID=72036 RepID=A0A0K2UAW7_LEPSM